MRRLAIGGWLVLADLRAGVSDRGGTEATSPTESPSVTPTPTQRARPPATSPQATKIELVASSALFNVTCLVVPSGEPLDVTFRNKDGVNHNFSIYTLEFASEFTGEISYPGERPSTTTSLRSNRASTSSSATSILVTCPAL